MNQAKPKVLVLGGGFGGLETAFYLKMLAKDNVDISLVSDKDYFLFKPNTIYIPFGMDPEKLKIKLEKTLKRKNISFIQAKAKEIDPNKKIVHVNGQKLSYDYLVVATGASMRPEEIPGLSEYANTIWTPEEMLELRKSLEKLVENVNNNKYQKVLFVVPPFNKCSGPLYEIVMMLDTWLRRKKIRNKVQITWTTFENTYIQAFGPRLHEVVTKEFERRNITGYNNYIVKKITKNEVIYENGQSQPYDLLISFPPYIASTKYEGLKTDDRGFIPTELTTRQVIGHPEIYAVGDSGDFPVKQAFLAFLQSDTAATHLASIILNKKDFIKFTPISMCVMEQFDKATFAQVPLRLTGDPIRPIEVNSEALSEYKVGSMKVWRLGKKLLGLYLPWRFGAGNPFHAGLPWAFMEVGLKVMSKAFSN